MAAPVFTVQNMLGDSNTTTSQGANECTFEQWVAEQNGDLVLHKNDIVVPLHTTKFMDHAATSARCTSASTH